MRNQCSYAVSIVRTSWRLLIGVVCTATSARPGNKNGEFPLKNEGTKMGVDTGFFCNAKALSKTERQTHSELTARLAHARAEVKELADGYSFRLKGDSVSLFDLATWIAYERRCCPFFDFEVQIQRDDGPLWLSLKGRDGVKVFIRAEFGAP